MLIRIIAMYYLVYKVLNLWFGEDYNAHATLAVTDFNEIGQQPLMAVDEGIFYFFVLTEGMAPSQYSFTDLTQYLDFRMQAYEYKLDGTSPNLIASLKMKICSEEDFARVGAQD